VLFRITIILSTSFIFQTLTCHTNRNDGVSDQLLHVIANGIMIMNWGRKLKTVVPVEVGEVPAADEVPVEVVPVEVGEEPAADELPVEVVPVKVGEEPAADEVLVEVVTVEVGEVPAADKVPVEVVTVEVCEVPAADEVPVKVVTVKVGEVPAADEVPVKVVPVEVGEVPAADEVSVEVGEEPVAGELPKAVELVVKYPGLRRNAEAHAKLRQTVEDTNNPDDDVDMTDSDEYFPEDIRRYCGIAECNEDIFIACHRCPALLCYDHMETTCDMHTRPALTQDQLLQPESSSDDSKFAKQPKQCKNQKRKKREKQCRHFKGNSETWKKNVRKRARLSGQEYISTAASTVHAKSVQTCVCNHGRQAVFRCEEFSEDDRKKLLLWNS